MRSTKTILLSTIFSLFASSAAVAQDTGPKIDETSQDQYQLLHWRSSNARSEGPDFSRKKETLSALLYNIDRNFLVQCHFLKIGTDPKDQEAFAQYDPQLYVRYGSLDSKGLAMSVADTLRPSKEGLQGTSVTFGSCVPFETTFGYNQRELVQKGELPMIPLSVYYLGEGGADSNVPDSSFEAATVFKDWHREARLSDEQMRAENRGSNLFETIWHDRLGNGSFVPTYIRANASACENTGDFTIAETIFKAIKNRSENEYKFTGLRLRGACPEL